MPRPLLVGLGALFGALTFLVSTADELGAQPAAATAPATTGSIAVAANVPTNPPAGHKPDLVVQGATLRCVQLMPMPGNPTTLLRYVKDRCNPGDRVELDIIVKNQGLATAKLDSKLWTLASSDSKLRGFAGATTAATYPTPQSMTAPGQSVIAPGGAPGLAPLVFGSLEPNQQYQRTVVILDAGHLTAGNHSVTVTVDPNGVVG